MIVAGIDVSKDWLDCTYAGSKMIKRVKNTPQGCLKLLKWLKTVELVVLESTGGYERQMVRVLWASKVPVAVMNPRWVRSFAKSTGKRAKNDSIDAEILMEYGEKNNPAPTPPVAEVIETLRGYLTRRQQLSTMLVMEKNHIQAPDISSELKRQVKKTIIFLRIQIKEVDKLIAEAIETSPEISTKANKLKAQTGVGPVLMTTLIADMPELGKVRRNVASALIGVAPYDDDSGNHSGKRFIAGGRVRARNILYMATLAAIRHDEHLKTFYKRLVARGKPRKVAIVACMRKFIIHLNGVLREDPSQHFMAA